MTENEFMLEDRIAKIQAINEQYDLEHNAYLSFSGGKDSTILHYLLDMALPNNKIPRVFVNTGIEFLDIVKFVKELAKTDDRFIILNNTLNIRKTLETYGYPFKSKAFAHNYSIFQHIGEESKTYRKMRDDSSKFGIPKILEYMFKDKNTIPFKISEMCCYKMKKHPVEKWSKKNHRKISITGMRKDEGGNREQLTCTIFDDDNLKKFHPLVPINDQWENWFAERERERIKLCKLYYSPYNFVRTGCKGCPFALNLQKDLDTMEQLLPNEKRQCEVLWKPVYDEYRRIGYRLRKDKEYKQLSLWEGNNNGRIQSQICKVKELR